MDDADVARLESVAQQFIARVHDDDPDANQRWLRATLPDPEDRERLLYIIAAAVPTHQRWRHLIAWTYGPDEREEYRRRYQREWMRRRRSREAA